MRVSALFGSKCNVSGGATITFAGDKGCKISAALENDKGLVRALNNFVGKIVVLVAVFGLVGTDHNDNFA